MPGSWLTCACRPTAPNWVNSGCGRSTCWSPTSTRSPQTVASGAGVDECIEQIDIGGPAMVRSAAKNHASVAVVTAPSDYPLVVAALAAGGITAAQRRALAVTAFASIAEYDVAVAAWCASTLAPVDADAPAPAEGSAPATDFPTFAGTALRRAATLRYGENPHQAAALYTDPAAVPGLAQARQLHGKEMSYNNYVDTDAAWRAANDFADRLRCDHQTCQPVRDRDRRGHRGGPPQGARLRPVSAYGGVIAVEPGGHRGARGRQLSEIFTEVLVAPAFAPDALEMLQREEEPADPARSAVAPDACGVAADLRRGAGPDHATRCGAPGDDPAAWRLVTGESGGRGDAGRIWRSPGARSASVKIQRDPARLGRRHGRRRDGAGQPGRLGPAGCGPRRRDRAAGSVAASDAFFPFADGLQVLIDAGVPAVVQPGGSIRDEEVIAAAARAGITMYFTGTRHFFH